MISTTGNKWTHIVLRGGHGITNYDADSVSEAEAVLNKAQLFPKVLVDCSHANSNKQFERQELVLKDVLEQCKNGSKTIMGFMIESNIHEGNRKVGEDVSALNYGVSITDQCISWETTERLLANAYNRL